MKKVFLSLICASTLLFVSSSCAKGKSESTSYEAVESATISFNQNDYKSTSEFDSAIESSKESSITSNDEVVLSIPALGISTNVLEGTSDYVLSIASGHVDGTGEVGKGNYCIAGHSGTGGDFIFNELPNIKNGERIDLISKDGICYTYYVTETFVVEPDEVWVLSDFADDRVTLITCTEKGAKRFIVVGTQMTEDEYVEYVKQRDIQQIDDLRVYNSQYTNICISDYLDTWRE